MKRSKAFFKAFFLSILIAAGVFSLIFLSSLSGSNKEKKSESGQSEVEIKSEKKLSLLLSISTKKGEAPYAYFLISANGGKNKIFITRLVENMSDTQNGEKKIFCEEYKKGQSAALSFLREAFSLDINAFLSLDDAAARTVFERFPPIVLNLKEPLYEVNREKDIYIKIDKGRQVFSPTTLLDYLKCTAFKDPLGAYKSAGEALCEFLNQNRENILLKKDFSVSSFVFENCKTNLTALTVSDFLPLFSQILKENSPCESISPEGEYKNAETEFRPGVSYSALITALF